MKKSKYKLAIGLTGIFVGRFNVFVAAELGGNQHDKSMDA
jgi:hypothetical protein